MLGAEKVCDKNGVIEDLDYTLCFPSEFPYEFEWFSQSSAVASPGESVQDSTETENSDGEDSVAGLTRRLSQSSIWETRKLSVPSYTCEKTEKTRGLAHSPQSTLSRMGSFFVRSRNSCSQVPLPASLPFPVKNDSWDVIYAATGEIACSKMTGGLPLKYDYHNRAAISASQAVTPVYVAKNPNNVLYSAETLGRTHHRPTQIMEFNKQVREYQILKQQCSSVWGQARMSWLAQPQPQQILSRGQSVVYGSGHCARPQQTSWAHNQPLRYSTSAIGDVAPSGTLSKRECAGTGVFLPRHYGNNAETRKKKTSCSPVLLPNWLVHTPDVAIKPVGFHTDRDAAVARRAAVLFQPRRPWRQDGATNQEVSLPQEWTY